MPSSNRAIPKSALLCGAIAFAAFTSIAGAQTPAAGAPVSVPPMDCPSPGDVPTNKPGMNTAEKFQKKVDDYKKCINAYTTQLRTKATDYAQMAKAYSDASNAAIEQYNAYVNVINEQALKQSGG